MRFYFNEASLQGQFHDLEQLKCFFEELLSGRARAAALAEMRISQKLLDQPACHGQSFRDVIREWRGSNMFRALLDWLGRRGPFIEEDRLPEEDDYFECLGVDVSEGGLGEAARRAKGGEASASLSLPGGAICFETTPLSVTHGLVEAPIGEYQIPNYWEVTKALELANTLAPPASNWRQMVEQARSRFPKLALPDAIFEHPMLARDPFDAIIRDRVFVLLRVLNDYAADRTEGAEGEKARAIIQTYFQGDRALFTGESRSNQERFSRDLTFIDPLAPGRTIFAHWHGKISHKVYRIHFEWPMAADAKLLKVVYIGPKITKS